MELPERTGVVVGPLLAAGVFLRLALPAGGATAAIAALGLLLGWAALLWRGRLLAAVALTTILLSGYALMDAALRPPSGLPEPERGDDAPCRVEGVVSGLPRGRRWGMELRLRNLRIDTGAGPREMEGEANLRVWGAQTGEVRPGDLVRAEARLERPPGRRSPGGADARLRLAAEGIHLRGDVSPGPLFRVIGRPPPRAWRWAIRLRGSTVRLLSQVGQPEEGVLRALLLGDRSRVEERVEESLRASGLAHLLAVSGLHVGLVGLVAHGLAFWLLRRWPALTSRRDARIPASWAGLAAAAGYTFLTGAAIPTMRAFLVLSVFLVAASAERTGNGLNSLCLAGTLIVARWPAAIALPSFQLSFAAAGSVLAASRLAGGGSRRVVGGAIVSGAAFLGTAPLAAYHFFRLAPASVPATLLAVPLCGLLVLPPGLAASVLSVIWPAAAGAVILPAVWACRLLLLISGCLDGWAVETAGRLQPSPLQVAALLLVLATVPALRRRRARCLAALGLVLLAWGSADAVRRNGGTGTRVTFLDVGQGDSALVELPGGGRILVDAGPRFGGCDRGETVIVPCLRARGVRTLDALVLTHGHPDHVGGAQSVLASVEVKRVICPDLACARAAGVLADGGEGPQIVAVGAGDRIAFAGGVMAVLNPDPERTGPESENDRSLVFSLRTPLGAVLFTGDAGGRVLEEIARKEEGEIKAGVLKVPHHGSRDGWSRLFYERAGPSLGLISAGGGGFKLPEAATSSRIREVTPLVLETCRDGTVECIMTATGMKVTTWDEGAGGLSPHGLFHWLTRGW